MYIYANNVNKCRCIYLHGCICNIGIYVYVYIIHIYVYIEIHVDICIHEIIQDIKTSNDKVNKLRGFSYTYPAV